MEFVDGRPLSEIVPSDGLPVEPVLRYGAQIAARSRTPTSAASSIAISKRPMSPSTITGAEGARLRRRPTTLPRERPTSMTRSISPRTPAAVCRHARVHRAGGAARQSRLMRAATSGRLAWCSTNWQRVNCRSPAATSSRSRRRILRSPSPRAFPAHVPPMLRGIIQRCLAKDPAQRYQRAGEARAALEAVQSDAIPAAIPIAASRSRRPWLIGLVAVAIAALILGLSQRSRPSSSEHDAATGQLTAYRVDGVPDLRSVALSGRSHAHLRRHGSQRAASISTRRASPVARACSSRTTMRARRRRSFLPTVSASRSRDGMGPRRRRSGSSRRSAATCWRRFPGRRFRRGRLTAAARLPETDERRRHGAHHLAARRRGPAGPDAERQRVSISAKSRVVARRPPDRRRQRHRRDRRRDLAAAGRRWTRTSCDRGAQRGLLRLAGVHPRRSRHRSRVESRRRDEHLDPAARWRRADPSHHRPGRGRIAKRLGGSTPSRS